MERICYGCMKVKRQSQVCEHCGFPDYGRNQPHQLPIGAVIGGQYVIGRVLGQGGFGITYLGWDQHLEIPVAIKEYFPNGMVSRGMSQSMAVTCTSGGQEFRQGRERFLGEARTLAKLRKVSGIVQVHNFFEENNTAYIVMEYIEGITLQEYIRRRGGRLSVGEALTLLRPVADALSQVHQAGMIHRDISPDNIMIRQDGQVKLLDFGTARDVDLNNGGQLAHSTKAVLKHGFAPMEQYSGDRTLDLRADEYAFCATVYYCLTGQVPPDAPKQVMDGVGVNWAAVPGLHPRQIQALQRGMAFRAEDRFPSLDVLKLELFGTAPAYQGSTGSQAGGNVRQGQSGYSGHSVAGQQGSTANRVQRNVTEKKSKKWMIPAAVAVICILISLSLLMVLGESSQDTGAAPAASQSSGVSTGDWRMNVLMEDMNGADMDAAGSFSVLGSTYTRAQISSITFLDSLANAPQRSWDVSEDKSGKVKAWTERNGSYYDLYIAGDGGVRAPANCVSLFDGYENMTAIRFNGNFHTDETTSMAWMFSNCKKLTSLDITDFITSKVDSMSGMFANCEILTDVDLTGFDTRNVTDMCFMFYNCISIRDIDLSSFDTSNVEEMQFMFCNCESLETLGLDPWETGKVTNYERFMDDGVTYDGRPWEELFK